MRPSGRVRPVPPRERIRGRRGRSQGAEGIALRGSRVRKLRAPRSRSTRRSRAPHFIMYAIRQGARPAHHHASERWARGRRRVGVGEVRRGDRASGASPTSESTGRAGSTDTVTSGWPLDRNGMSTSIPLRGTTGSTARRNCFAFSTNGWNVSSRRTGRILRRPSRDDRLRGARRDRGGGDSAGAGRLGRHPAVTLAHARPGRPRRPRSGPDAERRHDRLARRSAQRRHRLRQQQARGATPGDLYRRSDGEREVHLRHRRALRVHRRRHPPRAQRDVRHRFDHAEPVAGAARRRVGQRPSS